MTGPEVRLRELPVTSPAEALRVIRALGKHRYVVGCLHLVHALADVGARADSVLADESIDKTSRDERLVRSVSDEELAAVLSWYWDEATSARAADALLDRIERFGVEVRALPLALGRRDVPGLRCAGRVTCPQALTLRLS
jgi:hypothetical protein